MKRKIICACLLFISVLSITAQQTYDGYTVTKKGSWCWFADPRALHYQNAANTINSSYIGYIDVHGNIKATQIDYLTGVVSEVLIRSYFQPDDHANPTFLMLPDERIIIFYSRHTDEPCFYYRISQKPGDITALGKEVRLATVDNTTYPSPFILSNDPSHIYLCWRGINWHPTIGRLNIADLDNNNVTFDWGPKQIVQSTGARPYAKYMSNGVDKIYLTYTTGHPDDENPNWVYFNYINIPSSDATKITLTDVTGTLLSNINSGVHNVNKTDYATRFPNAVVNKDNYRNWVWQVSYDAANNPVIAMVRISSDKTAHSYYHVKWNGSAWVSTFLTNAGGHFLQTPGLELCYSGGLALDDADPNIAYCSVPVKGVYEIIKYTVGGTSVVTDTITRNSTKNNVRPYLISKSEGMSDRLLWMHGDYYDWIVSSSNPKGYCTEIHSNFVLPADSVDLERSLLTYKDFTEETNGVLTSSTGQTTTVPATASGSFSVSQTLKISPDSYSGALLKIGENISYTLDATTMCPYITINGVDYKSSNRLATSDVWKTQDRGTGGVWYPPSKLDWFNLTVTCENNRVITYINGLIDQNIEVSGETLNLADVALGGFNGEIEEAYIYSRAINQAEVKAIADKVALFADFRNILEKIPTDVYSDIIMPAADSDGDPVTWSSSNPQVISTTGLVTLPSAPVQVTLTATFNGETVTIPVTVHPRDIEKNKVLYYSFDETYQGADGQKYVADRTGNGNNARVFGSAKLNGVLDLTANTDAGFSSNGYLLIPDGIIDNIRSYSVLVKVKLSRINALPRVYDFGSSTANSVFLRASALTAGYKYNGATTILINSTQSLTAGKETALAVTFDARTHTTKIYFDGAETASATTITNEPYQLCSIAPTTQNYIGRSQWQNSDNMDYAGTMDDFYFFNIALTPAEILALQSNGNLGLYAIETADNPVVETQYYNLQGIRIPNVEKGHAPFAYIVKQIHKSGKTESAVTINKL